MGDYQSVQLPNNDISFILQNYLPISHFPTLPGQPLYLKFGSNHPPLQPGRSPSIVPRYKELDKYMVVLENGEQLKEELKMYEYRKSFSPYLVNLCTYEIAREQSHCIRNQFYATIYTEHISHRLASFQKNKMPFRKYSNFTQNKAAENTINLPIFSSLNFDEGIYVLFNSCQGYSLLRQHNKLSYPTANSIGVTSSGQVKVWINQNFGINKEQMIARKESLVIEELINLVAERVHGNFRDKLQLQEIRDDIDLDFDKFQDFLTKFAMNFHVGKKLMTQRMQQSTSMKKKGEESPNLFQHPVMIQRRIPIIEKTNPCLTERRASLEFNQIRAPSNDKKYNTSFERKASIDYQAPNQQNYRSLRKNSVSESPNKVIRFVYTQENPISQYLHSIPVRHIDPFASKSINLCATPSKYSQSLSYEHSSNGQHQHSNYDKATFSPNSSGISTKRQFKQSELIERKLLRGTSSESNSNYRSKDFKKKEFDPMIQIEGRYKDTKKVIDSILKNSLLPEKQLKDKYVQKQVDISEIRLLNFQPKKQERNTSEEDISIKQAAQEFRQLLQSIQHVPSYEQITPSKDQIVEKSPQIQADFEGINKNEQHPSSYLGDFSLIQEEEEESISENYE